MAAAAAAAAAAVAAGSGGGGGQRAAAGPPSPVSCQHSLRAAQLRHSTSGFLHTDSECSCWAREGRELGRSLTARPVGMEPAPQQAGTRSRARMHACAPACVLLRAVGAAPPVDADGCVLLYRLNGCIRFVLQRLHLHTHTCNCDAAQYVHKT